MSSAPVTKAWKPVLGVTTDTPVGPNTKGYQYNPAWGSMDLGTLYIA